MSLGSPRGDHLVTLIEPVVAASGYDLEGVTVSPAGRRSLVRVVVDGDDGVPLDDVAQVSRAISAVLDEQDGIMGRSPYVLEVTSPGVDRPLSEPRHWRRSVGRLVEVELAEGKPVRGRVRSADEIGVDLDPESDRDSRAAQLRIEYAAVRKARVQVEFNHPEGGRR